jgi:hypothetical protein
MEPNCFDGNCIAWGYKTSAQVEAGLNCPDESHYSPADSKAAAELAAANAAAASAANSAAASAAGNAAAAASNASFDSASATATADVNAEVSWQKNIQILIWVGLILFIIVVTYRAVAYVINQRKKKQRHGRAPARSPK